MKNIISSYPVARKSKNCVEFQEKKVVGGRAGG